METNRRLGAGAALATIGALGTILAPLLGWTELTGAAGFALGFLCGVTAGAGIALCGSGLWQRRGEGRP